MRKRRPIFFALILISLAIYTSILLFANLSTGAVENDLKSWQEKKQIPSESNLQEQADRLQQALKYDPDNPDYLTTAAVLTHRKAVAYQADTEQFATLNREALQQYQHLLTLRPSWAPAWASIIAIKYDLWEYDEVMRSAIHNAARLAPWFKVNQHIILQAGYHGWPFIDDETREVVNQTLDRAMQLQPEETIILSLDQGFSDRLIPYLKEDEALNEIYQKEITTRKNRLQRLKMQEEKRKQKEERKKGKS
jgi:hypothetical protein